MLGLQKNKKVTECTNREIIAGDSITGDSINDLANEVVVAEKDFNEPVKKKRKKEKNLNWLPIEGQGSKSSQVSVKPANSPVQKKPATAKPPHAKAAAAKETKLFKGSTSGKIKKKTLKNKKKREKRRKNKADEADLSAVLKTRAENKVSVKENPSGLKCLKNKKLLANEVIEAEKDINEPGKKKHKKEKNLSRLLIEGQGSKSSPASVTSANPPVQKKPAAYKPPHAKAAAAKGAELFGGSTSAIKGKNAWKNKKKRDKRRKKKAAEAGSVAKDQKMKGVEGNYEVSAHKLSTKIIGDFKAYKKFNYRPPFNVLLDTLFLERFVLPEEKIAVHTIQDLLGGQFLFRYTKCVWRNIGQKRLQGLLTRMPAELYLCRERINDLRQDFGCVQDVIMGEGIDECLILATGNDKLKRLMRKLTAVPVISIRNHENKRHDLKVKDDYVMPCELVFEAYHADRKTKLPDIVDIKKHTIEKVLVDRDFIRLMSQNHKDNEDISKLLGCQAAFCSTRCAFKLEKCALHVDTVFCDHTGGQLTSDECIRSVVGTPHFGIIFVATGSEALKESLSEMCFVTVISFEGSEIILSKPLEIAECPNEEVVVAREEQVSSSLGKEREATEKLDKGLEDYIAECQKESSSLPKKRGLEKDLEDYYAFCQEEEEKLAKQEQALKRSCKKRKAMEKKLRTWSCLSERKIMEKDFEDSHFF